MPLLTPPDILPEGMRLLVRALVAIPKLSAERDELLELVAPAGLAEAMAVTQTEEDEEGATDEAIATGKHIASCSLTALTQVDVVKLNQGTVALAQDLRTRWRTVSDVTADDFAAVLLERMIQATQEGEASSSAAEWGHVGDLWHALELLHAHPDVLSPFGTPGESSWHGFSKLQQHKLGPRDESRWPVANSTWYLPLRRWAVYLGVGRNMPKGRFMADTTPALRRALQQVPVGTYSIGDFVGRCTTALPFLDASDSVYGHDAEREADHAVLSPGLSFALLAFETSGELLLEQESDTGGLTLRMRSDRNLDRRVTRVKWLNGSTDRTPR